MEQRKNEEVQPAGRNAGSHNKGVRKMTNTEHTKPRTKNTRAVALSVLAMLLAISLALLAGAQQQAQALILYTGYTVNHTDDAPDVGPGDNLCDTNPNVSGEQCTLRAAIQESNASAGTQHIYFGIPGTGVHTIKPASELPTIKDTVTIDGYTQGDSTSDPADDARANTLAKGTNAKLMVQLEGSQLGGWDTSGLRVSAPDVVIKGLVINRFSFGIHSVDAQATKIEGNFLGTNPSGTKAPGSADGELPSGVYLATNSFPYDSNATVGGPDPADRNIISGNAALGILLGSDGNEVSGNLIGTQRDGKSPLGNGFGGMEIVGANNVVGKAAAGYANTIAFNGGDGVWVVDISITGNRVISNSIFSNKDLGIDLGDEGVTPNDAGDPDIGPNNLQNYPVLSSAKKSAGKTTIKGKLNSTPGKTFKVQFFSNPKGTDEGKKLFFSRTVTTNGTGAASFAFATKKKVDLGQNMTATATSPAGDTSEFSAPRKVVAS
jgi:hypothetical protein